MEDRIDKCASLLLHHVPWLNPAFTYQNNNLLKKVMYHFTSSNAHNIPQPRNKGEQVPCGHGVLKIKKSATPAALLLFIEENDYSTTIFFVIVSSLVFNCRK